MDAWLCGRGRCDAGEDAPSPAELSDDGAFAYRARYASRLLGTLARPVGPSRRPTVGAARAGLDPDSPDALAVIERVEALTPSGTGNRAALAERLEAFTDRRVFRYWALVGIVNGWSHPPVTHGSADAWEWYAKALRAHADPA